MKSRSYMCPRYGKDVKSTNNLIRDMNACKIPITLLSCQPSNPELVLDYNTTNFLDLLLNTNKKDISSGTLNNNKERIRPADINNNKEDIR